MWFHIKSDDTKKISWLKTFSLKLKQQGNVFVSKNTTFDSYHASEIHDFQMNAKWDLKKKTPKKQTMNKFHKLQENGKDLEKKILAFVYAY